MFTTWVTQDQSAERLDAMFYAPMYRDAAARVAATSTGKTFDDVRISDRPIVYGVIKPEPQDSGAPMVRNLDFASPGIARNQVLRIPSSQNAKYKRSVINVGDLLVTIGGYVGTAAIVPSELAGGNINQHIARVSVDASISDTYFLWAFVECRYGKLLMQRWVSGTAQPGINLGDLRRIHVPYPAPAIQRAIGNKVRKAERLRELAASRAAAADAIIRTASFIDTGPSVNISPRWFDTDVVSPASWDAEFNRTMEAQEKLEGTLPLGELLVECRAGDPIKRADRCTGPYRYYGASGPIDSHDDWNMSGERILVAQDGTVGVAVVADGKYWANNHVWICRLKPEYSQRAVARYLTFFYPYWAGLTTGSVVPKVTSENLERLSVPRVVATATDAEKLLQRVEDQTVDASIHVEGARSAVESLIDGTLDEPTLLADGEAILQWLADNPSPYEEKST